MVSQGAELEKEMDVGKYMTVRTEQKTQRMEIQKEKFTEMKQEAEHKGVSDLQLSKQILQGIGLQSDGLIAQQLEASIRLIPIPKIRIPFFIVLLLLYFNKRV